MHGEINSTVNVLPPFKKLCMSIGELPASYLETMTYYETLLWFIKYLQETIIPTINNNGEAVAELQQLYLQLQDYVNTYFDNLDVQEEINIKLDQMVEDGTLPEIITHYIQLNGMIVFNTVDEMKNATNIIDGSKCLTLGYHVKNDGGGGKYTIREIENNETPDEGLVIAINNTTLVAELIYENSINAKQYGCYGDNTHDDTSRLNAFFELSANVDKIVNKGVYLVNNTIYIKGLWRQSTSGTNNGFVNFIFEKASINYQGEEDGKSIVFFNIFHQKIKGLSISRYSKKNQVVVIGCWHTLFDDCDIKRLNITTNTSVLDGKTVSSPSVQHITFNNVYILGDITINAQGSYANGIYFNECDIYSSNYDYCVTLLSNNSKQEIVFTNTDLSYASKSVFHVEEPQIGYCSVTLKNCYLDSAIKLFSNYNMNGVIFSNYDSILPANSLANIAVNNTESYFTTLNLNTYSAYGNSIPTFNVNLVKNGNFQTTGIESEHFNYLLGANSAILTKTWVSTDKNIFGRARHVVINKDGQQTINIASINAPWNGIYTFYVRFKITAGSPSLQFKFKNQYTTLSNSVTQNNEYILVTTKNQQYFTEGSAFNLACYITKNPNEDCEIEFYEVVICPGTLIIPNPPLHANAVL